MKMQITVTAPFSAKVAELQVRAGDSVETGDLLVAFG